MLSTKPTNQVWDIETLDKRIHEKYGEEYGKAFCNLSNSIARKIQIASYHHFQAVSLLQGDVCLETGGKEALERWAQAVLAAEANIIAYAHSMHSCVELISNLVTKALNLSIKGKTNIFSVIRACNGLPEIENCLTKIKDSEEFKYLRAFVNSHKHIEFIGTNYWIGLYNNDVSGATYGLKIDEFTYEDDHTPQKHHPEKLAYNFITCEFILLKDMIIKSANQLFNLIK